MRIRHRQNDVVAAKSRLAEHPSSVHTAANGQIANLNAKTDRIQQRAAVGRGVEKIKSVAVGVEREPQVSAGSG